MTGYFPILCLEKLRDEESKSQELGNAVVELQTLRKEDIERNAQNEREIINRKNQFENEIKEKARIIEDMTEELEELRSSFNMLRDNG